MRPVIRDTIAADRPALDRLIQALNSTEAQFQDDRDVSMSAARQHVDVLIEKMGERNGFHLTAEFDGRCIGWLMAVTEEAEGFYLLPEWRRNGRITDLVVDADYRGQGVGRTLIEEALARFKHKGVPRVKIAAVSDNQTAIGLYRSIGFTDYSLELDLNLT